MVASFLTFPYFLNLSHLSDVTLLWDFNDTKKNWPCQFVVIKALCKGETFLKLFLNLCLLKNTVDNTGDHKRRDGSCTEGQ